MNPLAILWLWRLGSAAVLVGSLTAGYFGWAKHQQNIGGTRVTEQCNTATAKQKEQAQAVLTKALADTESAQTALRELTVNLEKQREQSQAQNAADLRARRAGPRLQFAAKVERCGGSGAATQGEAPKPASDPGTATSVIQLPDRVNEGLYTLAGTAQSILIDYRVLYEYLNNPNLVCELRTP